MECRISKTWSTAYSFDCKSYVANTLLSYVRGKGNIAISTATTGIAATILDGARTFHSRFNCSRDISVLSYLVNYPNQQTQTLITKRNNYLKNHPQIPAVP
eukprot:382559_1